MLCEVPGCDSPVRVIPGMGVLCDAGHAYHSNYGAPSLPSNPPPPPAPHAPASPLRMPFGKYKGELIEELETGYLEWCLSTLDWMKGDVRAEMEAQVAARSGRGIVRERERQRPRQHASTRTAR